MTLQEAIQNRDDLYDELIIAFYREFCPPGPGDYPILRFWMVRANHNNKLRVYALSCTPKATQAAFESWWQDTQSLGSSVDGLHERYSQSDGWHIMSPDQFIPWVQQLVINNVRPSI